MDALTVSATFFDTCSIVDMPASTLITTSCPFIADSSDLTSSASPSITLTLEHEIERNHVMFGRTTAAHLASVDSSTTSASFDLERTKAETVQFAFATDCATKRLPSFPFAPMSSRLSLVDFDSPPDIAQRDEADKKKWIVRAGIVPNRRAKLQLSDWKQVDLLRVDATYANNVR